MAMRWFVTGGAGFIGRAVVRQLRERGDDVTAVVRDPTTAIALQELGVRLVAGNLGSVATIRVAMNGSEAVIHVAGAYRIGITPRQKPAMYEANVAVTERVLDAAIAIGIRRPAPIEPAS